MVKKHLSSLFRSRSAAQSHAGTESLSSKGDLSTRLSYTNSVTSLDTSSIRKRPRATTAEDDELDDYDTRSQRSRNPLYSSLISDGRILACPYSKRHPERYSDLNIVEMEYRGCSSGFWTDISRLKQHLYRVHCRPEHYCPCCFDSFPNDVMLENHCRTRSCPVRTSPFSEKMTKDQMLRLRKKTPRADRTKCWYAIWVILFPDTTFPRSPFAGERSTDLLQSYDAFYKRTAPSRLAAIIESRLAKDNPSNPPQLQLPHDLLEDSISELFQLLGHEFRPELQPIVQFDSLPLIPASRLIPPVRSPMMYVNPNDLRSKSNIEPAFASGDPLSHPPQVKASAEPNDFDTALAHLNTPFPDRTRLSYHSGVPTIEMYLDDKDTGFFAGP